jgi:hypothetical protein
VYSVWPPVSNVLKGLDLVQEIAVLDAVKRYWLLREASDQHATTVLRIVGLLKGSSEAGPKAA